MEYELKKTQVTFAKMLEIVNDAVDACFDTDENGIDTDFRPECKKVSLQCAFCENYLQLELSEDFDEAFATYMAVGIDDYNINKDQWYSIIHAVNDKIEFRKQKLLNSQPKPVDEMYLAITTLLSTLNSKASELDVKKLDKVIKKLNPQEVMKAYKNSGIGNDIRDKAIHEQAQEIIDLKNQISARNVMTDKTVGE